MDAIIEREFTRLSTYYWIMQFWSRIFIGHFKTRQLTAFILGNLAAISSFTFRFKYLCILFLVRLFVLHSIKFDIGRSTEFRLH